MDGRVRITSVRAMREAAVALRDCTDVPIRSDALDLGAKLLDEIISVLEAVDIPLVDVSLVLNRGRASVTYNFGDGVGLYTDEEGEDGPIDFTVYVHPQREIEMSRFFSEMMKTDLGFRFVLHRSPGADSVRFEDVEIVGGRLDDGGVPEEGGGIRDWDPAPKDQASMAQPNQAGNPNPQSAQKSSSQGSDQQQMTRLIDEQSGQATSQENGNEKAKRNLIQRRPYNGSFSS